MSENKFKANVLINNNPTYSLTIEGLTQGHIDRLHAILNHSCIMDFLEDKDSRFSGPFTKTRESLSPVRGADLHSEFHKLMVKKFSPNT